MPKNIRSLDGLLAGERHGTFHDAVLLSADPDYTTGILTAEFDICVGDPDAHEQSALERQRRGRVRVDGLILWSLPPARLTAGRAGLWLTNDGSLHECPTETGRNVAKQLGPDGVAWFLYFTDLNAFGYLAGARATFSWS